MLRYLAILIVAFLAPSSAFAQAISPELQAKVDLAARIGKEINDYDQAAWRVTDALMAVDSSARSKPIAYVTERVDAEHVRTVFLLLEGDAHRTYFAGVVKGSEIVSTENYVRDANAPSATPEQIDRLNLTLQIKKTFANGICGKPVNTAIFPAIDQPGSLDIYLLASETQSDVVQFGGHMRIRASDNGRGRSELKEFSNTCLAMSKDRDSVGLMVTLPPNLGDTPTEMHVFKSLSHGIPIFVMAGEKLWEVSGDRITNVPMPKPN